MVDEVFLKRRCRSTWDSWLGAGSVTNKRHRFAKRDGWIVGVCFWGRGSGEFSRFKTGPQDILQGKEKSIVSGGWSFGGNAGSGGFAAWCAESLSLSGQDFL